MLLMTMLWPHLHLHPSRSWSWSWTCHQGYWVLRLVRKEKLLQHQHQHLYLRRMAAKGWAAQ